eukprot:721277_1
MLLLMQTTSDKDCKEWEIGYINMICKQITKLAGDSTRTQLQTNAYYTFLLRLSSLCTSIYEHIRYLTDSMFETNEYYTRLNEQYRFHPQIYEMTSGISYITDHCQWNCNAILASYATSIHWIFYKNTTRV